MVKKGSWRFQHRHLLLHKGSNNYVASKNAIQSHLLYTGCTSSVALHGVMLKCNSSCYWMVLLFKISAFTFTFRTFSRHFWPYFVKLWWGGGSKPSKVVWGHWCTFSGKHLDLWNLNLKLTPAILTNDNKWETLGLPYIKELLKTGFTESAL